MKRSRARWLSAGLCILLAGEVAAVNIYISRINELRRETIPREREFFRKSSVWLDKIRKLKKEGGPAGGAHEGPLLQGRFKKLARAAGVPGVPEVRQYPARLLRGERRVYYSEVRVTKVKGDALAAFLDGLENIGGANRIKELDVTARRGSRNVFDVRVLFATYVRVRTPGSRGKK